MRGVARYLAMTLLLLMVCNEASAQWMKERGWVRKGNRQYEKKAFDKSVESYEKALYYDPSSFEAKYDHASALYKTERYDKAEGILKSLLSDSTRTELERGELSYNLGNTQFAQKKYEEALAAYRYAMRCNPNDEDAKFNYAFTKRMMQQQEQEQNQENKENQDQEQNQDGQDNNDQQDKQDKKGQQGNKDQSQSSQNKGDDREEQDGQRAENRMTEAQQEALLQAIQAEEDKTQEKVKEKAAVIVKGGKNW